METILEALLEYGNWGAYILINIILIVWLQFTRTELKDERKNSKEERERHHDVELQSILMIKDVTVWIKAKLGQ